MACEDQLQREAELSAGAARGGLSIGRAALLMLLGWSVGLGAAAVVHLLVGDARTSAVGNVVGLGLMAWVGCRRSEGAFREVFAVKGFGKDLLLPMVLMAMGGATLVAEMGNLVEEIVPVPEKLREMFLEFLRADDWQGFLWRAAMLSLMAPVTEEAVFRGVFQFGFTRRYGVRKGIVAASVCFGVFHLIPWQAVSTILVGLLLGLVVYRTGSIFAGMAMHAIWNMLPLMAVTLLRDRVIQAYGLEGQQVSHVPIPGLLLSAGLFYLGFRAFWHRTDGLATWPELDAGHCTCKEADPVGLPPDDVRRDGEDTPQV